ncbi:hypothetical protein FPJ27_07545 [Burkholderia sp. MS455]|nr:hypothetical protein FPJ27_07545 [Burkholderia sp. MS455]
MSLKWVDPMPQGARVAGSVTALRKGRALVCDALMSCPQASHGGRLISDATDTASMASVVKGPLPNCSRRSGGMAGRSGGGDFGA